MKNAPAAISANPNSVLMVGSSPNQKYEKPTKTIRVDDLLNGLELGQGIDLETYSVGRNGQPVFDQPINQLAMTAIHNGAVG